MEWKKFFLYAQAPRKNGNTSEVLSECAGIIENHGLTTETIYLRGKNY